MPCWYRGAAARDDALSYYYVLRSVLRDHSELRGRCLTRCCHCGIFFLTHPRNAGREDLRCPFGCREAHRRQRSTERSMAYYRTPEGRLKKKVQNDKRSDSGGSHTSSPVVEEPIVPIGGVSQQLGNRVPKPPAQQASTDGDPSVRFDRELVLYLAMVLGLIEGREMSPSEVEVLLCSVVRQHSIARRRRLEYAVWYLNNRPP